MTNVTKSGHEFWVYLLYIIMLLLKAIDRLEIKLQSGSCKLTLAVIAKYLAVLLKISSHFSTCGLSSM